MEDKIQQVYQHPKLSPESIFREEEGTAHVYLYEDVTEFSVNRVIGEIDKYEGNEVILHVKTHGGLAEDTLALIDTIITKNVTVQVDGFAHSAGFFIFCAANRRLMGKHANLVYHNISYGLYGDQRTQERYLNNSKKLKEMLQDMVIKNTKITQEMLDQYNDKVHDWYIWYNEAVELGLVTHEIKVYQETVPAFEIPESVQTINELVEVGTKDEVHEGATNEDETEETEG